MFAKGITFRRLSQMKLHASSRARIAFSRLAEVI